MSRNVILAPHLDDEIIGCFSILKKGDIVFYFKDDYRAVDLNRRGYPWTYEFLGEDEYPDLLPDDVLYIPSRYDYHPLHRVVNRIAVDIKHSHKMWYSVEMNTPWLQEEEHPKEKLDLFQKMYPREVESICKNDKYFLFKSIEPFDELIWASIKFQRELFHCWIDAPPEVGFLRNLHRHIFFFEVDVQQFGDDRDLEYFILRKKVMQWFDSQTFSQRTSCEMFARAVREFLLIEYPGRQVCVSVFEDDENGCRVE